MTGETVALPMSPRNYSDYGDDGAVAFTLQGINISHLGKRKIIFKMLFLGDMLVTSSLEGILYEDDVRM